MESDLNNDFAHRLLSAESSLHDVTDRVTFAAFDDIWIPLSNDLEAAIEAESLEISTISMAYSLAHRVPIIMNAFLDVEVLSDQLLSALNIDAAAILDSSAHLTPEMPNMTTSRGDLHIAIDPSLPKYIEPSYKWLLQNIHNPYPSTHTRNIIAEATNSSRKDIDAWFIDVRRRIGWNALRKKHFSNKRTDIVEAATHFFLNQGSTRTPHILPSDVDFACIEAHTRDLYPGKFLQSELATKLNTAVMDVTPEKQVKVKKHQPKSLEKDGNRMISGVSYDLSNSSSNYSTSSLFSLPDENNLETTPPHLISRSYRKRPSSSNESSETETEDKSTQYPRIDASSSDTVTVHMAGLLSPTPSIHEPLSARLSKLGESPSPSSPTNVHFSKRKRRLSDTNDRNIYKQPRFHYASNRFEIQNEPKLGTNAPFTTSNPDKWFNDHTKYAARTTGSNSYQTELELYDFSGLDEVQLPNIVENFQHQGHNVPTSVTELSDLHSFDLDLSSNLFNYDETFASDDYEKVRQDYHSHSNAKFNPVSSLSLESNSHNTLDICESQIDPHIPDHALIVDATPPVSYNPAIDLDWAFSPFNPFPSSDAITGDKDQDFINVIPPADMFNYPTAMRHFLGEPEKFTFIMPESRASTQSDRAAKQRKLREIKETARQLEAELTEM